MTGLENEVKSLISRPDQFPLGLYSEVEVVDSSNTTSVTASPGVIHLVDASSAAVDVTLEEPQDTFYMTTVKKVDSSGNAVNVETPNSETIDGNSSLSITSQFTSREIVDDGSNYFIV